ncbi:MAG: polyribonucleotide nucleotidyltransferase [Holosporales bacterium]|jgi:polyribonucleotide nucleotidyltransferase|nr:polyribonucleotide nucleotidyltransferase [Holosporales bacterium]
MCVVAREAINWGGQTLSIETGKIARQADGAVVVKYGDTTVLCTCVFQKTQSNEASFFPLTISYQDRFYAAGKIPGGFIKREGKPSDREVLTSRLIDRPIRPLFPNGFLNEVQVICTTLSYDQVCDPGIASMIGASAALSISGIPFLGPIAGCNVGYSTQKGFILNPVYSSMSDNLLELTVAGTKEGILMVESEAMELSEEIMLDAVMFGFDSFQPVIKMIEELKKKVKKETFEVSSYKDQYGDLSKRIEKLITEDIVNALSIKEKLKRRDKIEEAKNKTIEAFKEEASEIAVSSLFEGLLSEIMRKAVMKTEKRVDGRKPDEIRQITCEIDVLPKVHGSALFTRGETQALVATTLGSSSDAQIVDDILGDRKEKFLLHYNFPPYSVGETGRVGAPGRREIGHGKLAWRAIHPVLPDHCTFPYSMRVVSEITESNGSSSMATVCGASMSLMSAGVPLKSPVAGIAMGLIKEEEEYIILSDIMGDEDHLGDMDFKVAGSENGITALQMDIKITSINRNIIKNSLEQAHKGRKHILEKMREAISENRDEMSPSAPRIEIVLIDKDKIRDLIGPGGKMIKEICEKTGAKIDIEDDGTVSVFSSNKVGMETAISMIKSVGCMPDVGAIFIGNVVKITDFGAFVSLEGGREGLLHISNISNKRVEQVSDVLKIGQEVKVKILDIDDRNRIKLTMKGC